MPLVFPKYCCKPGKIGRTPWSARVPLDPSFANGSSLMEHTGKPARSPAADQGVRPTL
jgi:hypothetical protein